MPLTPRCKQIDTLTIPYRLLASLPAAKHYLPHPLRGVADNN